MVLLHRFHLATMTEENWAKPRHALKSENFAKVMFSRNFAWLKFCFNKPLNLPFTYVGKIMFLSRFFKFVKAYFNAIREKLFSRKFQYPLPLVQRSEIYKRKLWLLSWTSFIIYGLGAQKNRLFWVPTKYLESYMNVHVYIEFINKLAKSN